MQLISSAQKDYLSSAGYVKISITGESMDAMPVQIAINEDGIMQGTVSIERNWALGNNIQIGCADTAELIFTLDNSQGQWSNIKMEGARLTVVLDIGGEPLQAGIYTVDEPPRNLTTMQIKALDDMARFNRPYDTDLAYPATLEQILADACVKCNVTQYTYIFDNGDYTVTEKPEGDDVTYHHIVAWVAELAGCNAWIDQLGRLQLSWYGDLQPGDVTGALEIGPDDRYQYELAETDIVISGIAYRTADAADYLLGTDDYALVIEDNPLLQNNFEAVLNGIMSKLAGFSYRPYKFQTLGYPHLWPGDKITKVTDAEGGVHVTVITNHTYRLNGRSELKAVGETEASRGYATGAPFTASQKRVLQSVAKVEASRQTSSLEQATLALNELMVNSLGFYTTIVEKPGGGKIIYSHDKPLLEESQIIWTQTEQGFAWTDQGWNGGNPVWQYGVASDGSMVIKLLTAIGINADWINAGKIRADFIQIGTGTDFDAGYDPSTKATPDDVANAEAAAKTYAEQQAAAAQTAATSLLGQLANGTYSGSSFIDGTTLYSPAVVGMTGAFLSLLAGNPSAAHLQMGEADGNPYLQMHDTDNKLRVTLEQEYLKFTDPSGANQGYMHAYDGRMNIYTNTTAINSRSWIELWGDSVYPDRQGEIIMGADHFVWRIDGSTTGAGTELMRLSDDGLSFVAAGKMLCFHGAIGDPSYLIATSDVDRQSLLMRTGGTNYAGINFYGSEDAYYPGETLIYAGGATAIRFYADKSARFYGAVTIDETVTLTGGIPAGIKSMRAWADIANASWHIYTPDGGGATLGYRGSAGTLSTFNITGHSHSYLPLSGGTLTGNLTTSGYVRADNGFRVGTATGINKEVFYTDRIHGAHTMSFTSGILTLWT